MTPADEFWHELVLNGIGGRTIEEAKERMSYAEAVGWSEYLRKRGSLHLGMRLELGIALLATLIVKASGGTAQLKDFLSHASEPEDREATVADVMAILNGAKR